MLTDRTFNQIFIRNGNAWCELLWEEKGRVIILSDYGDWSYWWGHKGDMSMPKFLANLDMEYMASKLFPNGGREYSVEATARLVREYIIQYRKEHLLSKEYARREWLLVEELENWSMSFDLWLNETQIQDAWELSSTDIVPTWRHFWERLWIPCVRPALIALQ